jgi:cobalt/nickel transport system permease protein
MSHSDHHHPGREGHHPGSVKMPWEPRTKLIAGVIFIFGVISLHTPELLVAALIFAIIFALWGGLAPAQLLKKLALLAPFLALMSLPLIFGAGFPPAPDRVEMAALILLKALAAMTFTLFIFTNQPIENMLEAMEHLKVPGVVTTVIYLAYRYGFLFISEMQVTVRALKARLFNAALSRASLPVYGEVSGGLFIKSLSRSETVYRAMASRGFRGRMPVGPPRKITMADLAKAASPPLLIAALLIVEQVVL